MIATTQPTKEQLNICSDRKELLEQAFDVIVALDEKQLKTLLERMGFCGPSSH